MSDLERLDEALHWLDHQPHAEALTAARELRAYRDLLAGGQQVEWCETHESPPLRSGWDDGGFRNPDGSSRCAMSFLMHEGYDDDYDIPCHIVSRLLVDPPKEETR